MGENPDLPTVASEQGVIARIKSEIHISRGSSRSAIGRNGLSWTSPTVSCRRRETGSLERPENYCLTSWPRRVGSILPPSRRAIFSPAFSSMQARVRRFSEQFGTVASQIDRIAIDLDRNSGRPTGSGDRHVR